MTIDCRLYVNGQIFGGWTDVSIQQSMSSVAGAFSIGLTERWAGRTETWAIPAGAQCRVEIGGQTVITGYVDSVQVSHAASQHSITVSGRDATGDLVDCSAENGTYLQQPFVSICRALVAPYGIAVVDQAGVSYTVKRFVVQTGESVFQALERAARLAGVLLTSDGYGRLILTQAGGAGRATTALVTGPAGNVLSASFTHDASQLYSVIRVKSQCTASGLNQFDISVASPEAELPRTIGAASTPGVDRYRPLTLVAETQALADRCRQRAAWEAGRRQALARTLTCTVQGWLQGDGTVWKPNTLVRVVDPLLRIDEDWLIRDVSFSLSVSGSTTQLTLAGPDAFTVLPAIPDPNYNKYCAHGRTGNRPNMQRRRGCANAPDRGPFRRDTPRC